MPKKAQPWLAYALMLTALVLTWVAYRPGLKGSFIFDDFANLPSLGAFGPIKDSAGLIRYLTSGIADPTGRPLAMASFLIDATDWPADPYSFKRTNLLIHLLNGCLLACFLAKLGQSIGRVSDTASRSRIDLAAVLAAALWMLHPLFVSTTLYVVQREAMLPATFGLAGLIVWLHGRLLMMNGQVNKGGLLTIFGIVAGTVLGTLCKANGLLLPALALTIEFMALRPSEATPSSIEGLKRYRRIMLIVGALPTLVVIGYLGYEGVLAFQNGKSALREWTIGQRLLTEPRVVINYLRLLWLPQPYSAGVFNDQFSASKSMLEPWTTCASLLGIFALISTAFWSRSRHPALATALIFYLVGLSMESTTISLELYFEHRNYLPAMLMFWPLALWLCDCGQRHVKTSKPDSKSNAFSSNIPAVKFVFASVLLAGLAILTYANADLWGNTRDQALLWAMRNPNSARAQAYAADQEMLTGHPELAVIRLRPLVRLYPDQVQLSLNLYAAECRAGQVDQVTLDATLTSLRITRDPGTLLASWFGTAIEQAAHPQCDAADLSGLQSLVRNAMANPNLMAYGGRRQDLYFLLGRIALMRGDSQDALHQFSRALSQEPSDATAFSQAALLGSHGFPQEGLELLQTYDQLRTVQQPKPLGMPRVHDWVIRKQGYWDHELLRLRETLKADIAADLKHS